ncbi:hypothetical protein K492DRAFT_40615 [Lichtheimia hyalospora FSU 10163]|nr:hypothetical protein K492DRAFT_40615 [Lichtheimia hyalospora FSU 10163]
MLAAEGSCSNSTASQSTLDRAIAVGKDNDLVSSNDDFPSNPNDSRDEQPNATPTLPPESSHRSIRRSLHALGNKVSRQQQRTVSPPPPLSPNRAIYKRPSDDSIRSNFSSTSSVFSTASKISKFPHAVKSSFVSVKDYVAAKSHRRRTMVHSPTNTTINGRQSPQSSSTDHHSFASRFRRRAPSVMGLSSMFSKENAPNNNISPSVSSIHSPAATEEERPPSSSKRRLAGRRNSVLDVAARLLHTRDINHRPVSSSTMDNGNVEDEEQEEEYNQLNNVIQQDKTPSYDEKAIGKLLFGVDIENMEFFDQDMSRSRASSIMSGKVALEVNDNKLY